jgi:DNA replication and repair protein RecF
MYLEGLSLIHFKNFAQAEIQLSPRINCFTGKNGVGKTNLLDAIHYLSLTKSNFNAIDAQNHAWTGIHGNTGSFCKGGCK